MTEPGKVYEILNRIMPFDSRRRWDNSGLLVDCGEKTDKILVCLDITHGAVNRAKAAGAGIIVSHHPVIFSPLKTIDRHRIVYKLIENKISAVCAHTNFDLYSKGTGYAMAQALGLEAEDSGFEYCTWAVLPRRMSCHSLARKCKEVFGAAICSFEEKTVSRLIICPGSSGSMKEEIIASGAHCLVTGECKYHDVLDLRRAGVAVIQTGHDLSEICGAKQLAKILQENISEDVIFYSEPPLSIGL